MIALHKKKTENEEPLMRSINTALIVVL